MAHGTCRKFFGIPDVHRLDQPALGCRQQLRDPGEVMTANLGNLESGGHVDAHHMARRRQAQLPEAGIKHVPGLVFFRCPKCMFNVGTKAAG
jgi:hypothetical protein